MEQSKKWNGKDTRCVHLDFHTSEHIKGIGADFDKDEFAKILKDCHLNSITLFAKCHHGCFYYKDSKFFVHPHLERSLLDEQLEACKKAGVSAKIYISAGCDDYTIAQHPEWLGIYKKGEPQQPGHFRRLCFNTPYLELLKEQTREVVEKYKPDGVFFDIVANWPCYCDNCIADMKKKGLDPEKEEDLWAQSVDVINNYFEEINKVVHQANPDTVVFHNCGAFPVGARNRIDAVHQLEVESLPTGGWGYDHFPMTMSYIRRQDKNCIGMTGKFHRSWGEFGGCKYKEALRYEAALNLTFGAGMSIGDQLHPSGKPDRHTYEMIAETMNYMKDREQFIGGKYLPELALYTPNEENGRIGASRILQEGKYLFDLIDDTEIENGYPLIIVAEDVELKDNVLCSLKAHVDNGGKIIAVGKSAWSLQQYGVDLGMSSLEEDDLLPAYYVSKYQLKEATATPLVVYGKVYKMGAKGEVLAENLSPYFTRSVERYCSHFQTPFDKSKVSPAIVRGKDGVAIGANLFALYTTDGSMTPKILTIPLINEYLKEKRVETTLPSTGKVALYEKDNSHFIHLCYANTIARGGTEVVEDIVTLSEVKVSIKLDKPSKVILRPENKKLRFKYINGRVEFALKDFNCYSAIELVK